MKNLKKVLALVLALATVMGLGITASAKKYTDSNKIEYTEAVEVMSAIDVLGGMPDGSFNPQGNLTREQAAKMVSYLLNGGNDVNDLYSGSNTFVDCYNSWAKGYIAYANQMGIVSGVGNGKFNPKGTLTGVQLAKMMLTSLGYDAKIEGYVNNNNWMVNIIDDARNAGLLDGMDDVNLYNAITREQASQMMFNALKANMVGYTSKGTEIELPGLGTIVTGASDAKPVENKASSYVTAGTQPDGYVQGSAGYQQMVEKYFSKLTLDASDSDNFGRSAHTWSYKGDEIVTVSDADAVVTYTAKTKAETVQSNLKGYTYAAGLKATVNNNAGTSISSYSDVAALTANGDIVEVYATNKVIDKVVVIKTEAAKVTAVNDTKKTFTISYNAGANTAVIDENSEFYGLYGAVKKDDVLAISEDAAHNVLNLYVPTSLTGKITYVKTDNTEATVGGQTVKAVNGTTPFAGKLNQEAVVYLSKEGYVISVDSTTTSSAQYIYVTNMWTASGSYGSETQQVKGVLADGTITTLTVENPTTNAAFTDPDYDETSATVGTAAGNVVKFENGITPNKVYEYVQNKTDGSLNLLKVPEAGGSAAEGTYTASAGIGASDAKINSTYIASDVSFVYVNGTGDGVKATTGGKAAIASGITYDAVIEKVGNDYLVTVVFVSSASISSTDVVYISNALGSVKYVDASGKEQTGTKVEYYTVGSSEVKTMTVAAGKSSSTGFYTLTADGDAFATASYGTENTNKQSNQAITAMYNGYATVNGKDFDFKNATIVDVTNQGISTVEALEAAFKDATQEVKVSFTYDANNKVDTVYVVDINSNNVALTSVTLNGTTATTASADTGLSGKEVAVAKNTALNLVVVTDDANATYEVTFDNDGKSYAAFNNGVDTSADADETTGYFKIVVTAEDGTTTGTYYVAFKTPAAG